MPYEMPPPPAGRRHWDSCSCPNYRVWVIAGLAGDLPGDLGRDRRHPAGLGSARDENAPLVSAFGSTSAHGHHHLRLRRRLAALRGRAGRAHLPGQPLMGRFDHRGVRGGRHRRDGSILGSIVTGFILGILRASPRSSTQRRPHGHLRAWHRPAGPAPRACRKQT